MSALYNVCVKLIDAGRTEGLRDKIDVFYAYGRLSDDEYNSLVQKLAGEVSE